MWASDLSEAHLLFRFFVGEYLLGDIHRSALTLLKGAPHIFTDDADAYQLYTAQQQDQHDEAGIAGNSDAPNQFLQHHHD